VKAVTFHLAGAARRAAAARVLHIGFRGHEWWSGRHTVSFLHARSSSASVVQLLAVQFRIIGDAGRCDVVVMVVIAMVVEGCCPWPLGSARLRGVYGLGWSPRRRPGRGGPTAGAGLAAWRPADRG